MGCRVLLVEDDRDAAEALAELMALWGHDVTIADDGAAATAAAQGAAFDVVLLDLGLPDADGADVACALRTALGPRARLVALTGRAGPDTAAADVDAHLTKPVDFDALAALLRAAAP